MYNNYNNSPNLIISKGSVVSCSKKHSSIKLPNFFKTCSCSLVNSQTNFDDVSMYLKFVRPKMSKLHFVVAHALDLSIYQFYNQW